MTTLIETLADFAAATRYDDLPAHVAEESRRLLLDSIGCAIGGLSHSRGEIALAYARMQGPGVPGHQARVLGTPLRTSINAASFANAELINALDFDAILPPGHVTPYVLPGALAFAEAGHTSGQDLLCAIALAHEMSNRIGKAQDYLRDVKDGKISPPPVHGYSSTVFGATAAIGRVKGHSAATMAHAMGIAGSMACASRLRAWNSTKKQVCCALPAATRCRASSSAGRNPPPRSPRSSMARHQHRASTSRRPHSAQPEDKNLPPAQGQRQAVI